MCDKLKAEQWLDYSGEPRACYPKAAVDETIAELEEKVDALICSVGVIQEMAEMKSRHHKYKRCKAMAYVEWLKEMILCNHPEGILFRRVVRRKHKWLELAEKFKEAK